MEPIRINPGYYMTKCWRSVNMSRKYSYIYRMSELQKKREGAASFQKKQEDKNLETEEASYEKGSV